LVAGKCPEEESNPSEPPEDAVLVIKRLEIEILGVTIFINPKDLYFILGMGHGYDLRSVALKSGFIAWWVGSKIAQYRPNNTMLPATKSRTRNRYYRARDERRR
jgi:hypothetical protein